jgi:hypothetical protein
MRWEEHEAQMWKTETHKISDEKYEQKKLIGRPRYRWEDIKEVICEGVDLIPLAQDRAQ